MKDFVSYIIGLLWLVSEFGLFVIYRCIGVFFNILEALEACTLGNLGTVVVSAVHFFNAVYLKCRNNRRRIRRLSDIRYLNYFFTFKM